MTLLVAVLYAGIGLAVWARATATIAWTFAIHQRDLYPYLRGPLKPDGEQWFGASLLGALLAAIWPLTMLLYIGRKHLSRVLRPPPTARLRALEEENRRLEHELEMRRG
jgi:hypothetical protein